MAHEFSNLLKLLGLGLSLALLTSTTAGISILGYEPDWTIFVFLICNPFACYWIWTNIFATYSKLLQKPALEKGFLVCGCKTLDRLGIISDLKIGVRSIGGERVLSLNQGLATVKFQTVGPNGVNSKAVRILIYTKFCEFMEDKKDWEYFARRDRVGRHSQIRKLVTARGWLTRSKEFSTGFHRQGIKTQMFKEGNICSAIRLAYGHPHSTILLIISCMQWL